MEDWTSLVGATGVAIAPPALPNTTMTMDSNVEQAGQGGTTLGDTIGGFTISKNRLVSGSGATGVGLDSSGQYPAIFAGSNNPDAAKFRVDKNGLVSFYDNLGNLVSSIDLGLLTFYAGSNGNYTVGTDVYGNFAIRSSNGSMVEIDVLSVSGGISISDGILVSGHPGITDAFLTNDGRTATVTDGIITDIS